MAVPEQLFAVIATFGLIFVILSSLSYGLANTVSVYRAPVRPYRGSAVGIALADFIAIPVIIIGLLAILPLEPQLKMTFCVLALTAGAPFVPMMVKVGKGNVLYAAGMVGFLTIVTWVVVPLVAPIALSALGTGATPSAWFLAWPLIAFMVIPLVAGLLTRAYLPELAQLGLQHLPRIALAALLFHITLYIFASLPEFTLLSGTFAVGFSFAFVAIALAIGYAIGPRGASDRGARVVSTVALAQRNTSVCIVTFIFALAPYAIAGVTMLISSLITIVVLLFVMAAWGKRYTERQETAQKPSPTSASG